MMTHTVPRICGRSRSECVEGRSAYPLLAVMPSQLLTTSCISSAISSIVFIAVFLANLSTSEGL